MAYRWVGIDCGFSQMSIAIIDGSERALVVERTRQPPGDGHERDVALARLRELLKRLRSLRDEPVWLAGYCYDHAGVYEAFEQEGWSVADGTALNDVVGVYGLTDMRGHVVVCGCGSWSQVVYVDRANAIRWPGEDISGMMPTWLLSGWAYANFLVELAAQHPGTQSALARAIEEKLGGTSIDRADGRWGDLGPLLSSMIDHREIRRFLAQAADAVLETRDLLWRTVRSAEAPGIVIGGGAVRDDRLWAVLELELQSRGVRALRIIGENAVGLARFAKHNPGANAWSFVGAKKPSWLS